MELEAGNFYWMYQVHELIWRVCYISQDHDDQLWINVLGVDFNMPLHMLGLEYFTFLKISPPFDLSLI